MRKTKWTLALRILLMGTGLGALTVLQGFLSLSTMYRTRAAIGHGAGTAQQALAFVNRGIPEVWTILLLTVVLGTTVALLFARMVSRSLAPLERAIQLLGSGVLKGKVDIRLSDDIGFLASYMNGALDQMTCTVSGIDYCSNQIASAAEEILGRTEHTAKTAANQRDQILQIGQAMKEMVTSVQQVAADSQSASLHAANAVEMADQGGTLASEALEAMKSIADSVHGAGQRIDDLGRSTAQIGKIVAVINEIAEQTNLLALNAAIEAARAGEQGRGFAVVAGEVRRLAERTALATKEIAQMIASVQRETREAVAQMQEGTARVGSGVEATSKARNSLEKIIAAARDVGDMISRISRAATLQDGSAVEINSHLEQMSCHTGESAADVQDSTQSCQNLSELSASLKKIIGQFEFHQIIREGTH